MLYDSDREKNIQKKANLGIILTYMQLCKGTQMKLIFSPATTYGIKPPLANPIRRSMFLASVTIII